ncbi:uncharacterized protein THITE_2048380 [Thermothielavioides terrestris NRRL 8126]|uniref:Uncharacterized protein n=1 Tax=Thermothielavioides terrestris (strain ATCC 38088 / NRRL 8126) TaxID=578455 RepID=G2QZL9_THETT|nr:uncharacterized protein THITE_2048380 [Thermothielavioides terrestris NRRL 8126]AEO66348.1 hypothetical protein THITE_2048380 [Thermothielavioides terrestris NRRL 8126]
MVQTYSIFGKQVASHYLAMGVLGTLFGGVYLSTGGSKKTPAAPPINASSPDEADFIKCAALPVSPVSSLDVGCLTWPQEVHRGSRRGGEEGERGEALG